MTSLTRQASHFGARNGRRSWLDISKSLLSGRNDESPKSIIESGEPIRDCGIQESAVPKIDIAKATVRIKGVYPEPWRAITEGREKAALGDVVGLTQFGVNLTRLKPGVPPHSATGTSPKTSSFMCSRVRSC